MPSGPLVAVAGRLDGIILNNALGTANSASFGAAGSSSPVVGTQIDRITFESGPTTSPASVGQCALFITNGTITIEIFSFTISNSVRIRQATFTETFVLPAGWSFQAAVSNTLTSGATILIAVFGRDMAQQFQP